MIPFVATISKTEGYAVVVEHCGEYRRHSQHKGIATANLKRRDLLALMRAEGEAAVDWECCDLLTFDIRPTGTKRFKLV